MLVHYSFQNLSQQLDLPSENLRFKRQHRQEGPSKPPGCLVASVRTFITSLLSWFHESPLVGTEEEKQAGGRLSVWFSIGPWACQNILYPQTYSQQVLSCYNVLTENLQCRFDLKVQFRACNCLWVGKHYPLGYILFNSHKKFFFYFTLSFDVEQFYLIKKHPEFIRDDNIPLHPSSSIPLVSGAETATCCLFFYFVSREVHLLPQKTLE